MTRIDEFSSVPLFIEALLGDQQVASGTGFTYRVEKSVYLITNWHNFTGRNPQTGVQLFSAPNQIRVWLHVEGKLGSWRAINFPVVGSDGAARWFEHPTFKKNVDVVAIELEFPSGVCSYHANERSLTPDLRVGVGSEVFVTGFPFGIMGGGIFPIWKRASVATEIEIDLHELPKLFIDTASRAGMSGSPVIARVSGAYSDQSGNYYVGGDGATRFIGVYSGRIGAEDELQAQLGIVWKQRVIDEIIAAKSVGTHA